jgi:hypothetical protein
VALCSRSNRRELDSSGYIEGRLRVAVIVSH